MAPWWFAASLVGVTAVLGTLVLGFGRAYARTAADGDRSPVVRVTFWVAVAWTVLGVGSALVLVLTTLMQDDIRITVPIAEFWPRLPDGTEIDGPTASIDGGGFTSADLLARGLSAGTRTMWATSQALGALVPATIAALIAVVCWQLLAGRAFRPVVIRMAMMTAVVVTVGGVAAQVLGDIGGYQAGVELLQVTSASWHDLSGFGESDLHTWLPEPAFQITFPFWPIAAGLAFAALAAIFRYGSRLQRDTEGLV